MMHNEELFLKHIAYELRRWSIMMTTRAGSGHPTSCMSAADLVAAIFFHAMQFDPHNYENPDNDRFILSKGHASPLLYAIWKELGVLTDKDLLTYREVNSVLEGHPTHRFAYTEAATGSLGMGLSVGAGIELSARLDERDFYTYVLLGDSEIAEGSVWEAVEIAAHYALDHLIAVVDCNNLGQSTVTMDDYQLERLAEKFKAFGWHTIIVNGHDMQDIVNALDTARSYTKKPTVIIAKTVKGYGVASIEGKQGYHGKPFKPQELDAVLTQLAERFPDAAHYNAPCEWQPKKTDGQTRKTEKINAFPEPHYKKDEMIATRKAYGQALTIAGEIAQNVVSLDAEVKNSTYADLFEKAFPKRFFQCFIAEQNMVSMAVGMSACSKIPFISTFAAFLTRAHDQLRMAAVGQSPLRVCGSHAGVSIGQDGPSQMGLEDIAMMRALPESIVLYPCDAVSTHSLLGKMLVYKKGISYLRTTRMATPVIYDNSEEFPIGGCKILRTSKHDVACIIAAGITLHEALRAYERLRSENIHVAVVDLYSIKPLDEHALHWLVENTQRRFVTVEDHYLQGGLGEAVCYAVRNEDVKISCLAVTELPRSGNPEELLAMAHIDADAIIRAVKETL